MTVHAPFNFVPVSPWVYQPAWAPYVSHDVPFADGISGELEIEITVETPLLIGGEREKSMLGDQEGPAKVHPFKLGNDYAIPPASLQGCIRSVIEIATFSRFHLVDDRRFGVRDLNRLSGKEIYRDRVINKVRSGWLLRDRHTNEWRIIPCAFSRIHFSELQELAADRHFNWSANPPERPQDRSDRAASRHWKKARDAAEQAKAIDARYRALGWANVEQALTVEGKRARRPRAGEAATPGHIVVTGNTGQKGGTAKRAEFFFHGPEEPPRPVAPSIMRDFLLIHEHNPSWLLWKMRLKQGQADRVPVFFIENERDADRPILSFGLAMMFKLAHANSTHDLIANTSPNHLDSEMQDLATLLFGRPPSGNEVKATPGLKGRVAFDFALPKQGAPAPKPLGPLEVVLASPKPTYTPLYVRQHGNSGRVARERGYAHYTPTTGCPTAELAGAKRYPARPVEWGELRSKFPIAEPNAKSNSLLCPLGSGAVFVTRLRFHNLRPMELGALVWAITWGNSTQHRHALGMGKPLGLGLVAMRIVGGEAIMNDVKQPKVATLDQAECWNRWGAKFVEHMEVHYAGRSEAPRNGQRDQSWLASPQVRALLAMADPNEHSDRNLTYMRLDPKARVNEFADAKRDGYFLGSFVP